MRRGSRHDSIDLNHALAFRIHLTNRLLRTHLARFLVREATGLTPEQWFVIARLAPTDGLRQVDLAEPALGDPPNVSRLVDVLVARGIVERVADPIDRRAWLIRLTVDGRTLATRLQARVTDERRAVFAGFDDADLDRLESLLDRIDDNLRRLLSNAPAGTKGPVDGR